MVGSERFGLTEADVIQTVHELHLEIKQLTALLSSEDDRLKHFAQNSLPERKKELALFTDHTSPTEILKLIHGIYQRVASSERSGVSKEIIIAKIRSEFPDLAAYYWLLQKRPWGYNLGGAVISALEKKKLSL